MTKARIRGIYSTALTTLLLNHGFAIVQPSATARDRFNLESTDESPDLDVYDRHDLQGVKALGKPEPMDTFVSVLQSQLPDVIVRKRLSGIDGIYKGIVKEPDLKTRSVPVDIGTTVGRGILWRTAAASQPPSVLIDEIAKLEKEKAAIGKEAEEVKAPATLWEGPSSIDVEFPALSKTQLDTIRKSVVPTIDGHHYYKACGEKISSMLDMTEKLLQKEYPHQEAKQLLEQTIKTKYPDAGSPIKISHVKLDGRSLDLGNAFIEDFVPDESLIRFSRVFRKKGVYDGLKIRKEPGDRAVTETRIGGWHLETRYYSKGGRYKGTYINLNTPVELYPYGIRYVDLEIDVCAWPDGKVEKLDEEKLDRAATEGVVSQKLMKLVEHKARKILSEMKRQKH